MPMPSQTRIPAERTKPKMAEGRRLGIRALLLMLLLPAMTALLAFDAWTDHRAISRAVIDAHDQILIEPVQALSDSLSLDAGGRPQMRAAFPVQAMFDSTRSRYKQLRVIATPLAASGAVAGPALDLLGTAELPAPPAAVTVPATTVPATTVSSTTAAPEPSSQPAGRDAAVRFYDAEFAGRSLRIAALERILPASGEPAAWRVLIQAAEGTGLRDQALADAWHQALRNDLLIVLMMVLLVWFGVALSLRPLERLRSALAARRPGELAPLDTRGVPHEVAPLVEAVNQHVASQGRMLQEQRRFLADASHQLRTPLAIMLTQVGYALREREPEPMRETLRALAAQLARARRLSEQLMSLAQAGEATREGEGRALADLDAIARAVLLEYLPLAHEKQQDLGWEDAADDADEAGSAGGPDEEHETETARLPVAADAAELHEAFANLLHNAIKYTPPRGRITVSVQASGGFAEAAVTDSGPGIAPADRAAMFERFRRGRDAAAAGQSEGAGLGLAITRAYAERNGGEIRLEDAPSAEGSRSGLRASLRVPLTRFSR